MTIDKKVLAVRTIGNFLMITSIAGIFYTFFPVASAFTKHTIDNLRGQEFQAAATPSQVQSFGSLLGKADSNIKILIPKDPDFSIIVEKIGADSKVIPNVDPSQKQVYNQALKRGVAHALGTSFPGQPGVTYLFAHSTDTIFNVPRFNAVFYLLNEIGPGDSVVIFFDERRYDYKVVEKKITEPEDVGYFTLTTEEQILVLQTCYPPGTTWKRLLVIAKPVASTAGESSI